MRTSTIWARPPSRGQHDTCALATLWPGEEHPAGWQLDFRDDNGNLLSDLEVFCRTCRRAAVDLPEGDQPDNPIPEVDEDADGNHLLNRPAEFLAHHCAVGENLEGSGSSALKDSLASAL